VRAADTAVALLHRLTVEPVRGPLTRREEEVLALIAGGLSNAAIAASLVISEKTAGHHVSHILTKLGVPNRAAAAAYAARALG
jgi:DNA-binding NarL/FixJ family response regulator